MMSWWKRFWQGGELQHSDKRLHLVHLALRGWTEQSPDNDLRVWSDPQGDVLSLSVLEGSLGLPEVSDEAGIQRFARSLAEGRGAGLIETRVATGALGTTVVLLYKKLDKYAYTFTGMLIVPRERGSQVWTVVAKERGTTGVREAVVTTELMSEGRLSVEDYERSWAQDPYDPDYRGVDRSVLRFVSDDESYDERFPEHPLSKVRRVLSALPDSVQVDSGTALG